MRYLAERLAILESKQVTYSAPNSAQYEPPVERSTSSRASSVNSEYRNSSISGTKRKVDGYSDNVNGIPHSQKSRHSHLQSPSVDYRSPADGEYLVKDIRGRAHPIWRIRRVGLISVDGASKILRIRHATSPGFKIVDGCINVWHKLSTIITRR